ncbi:MAG: phosphoribosylformylglycinamidine synthase subunit PurL [Nitrospinota bacterium]|nr:phosphoribosylformylglycinamidine synthase subunit PurL [Nitrospinota bacterium]
MRIQTGPPYNLDTIEGVGLTLDEYQRVEDLLGRAPNWPELGILGVMWSEHCSYKSSKIHLKTLPTEGPKVLQGPGENAGAVDIGEGMAAVFKIESHNHPSFVEPHQGAATGVGGIMRDIFTMGARPVALMDSLRFGDPEHARTKYLLKGVVEGISSYGNCVGVPTVGGEVSFDFCYDNNILVNVFCLGLVKADRLFRAHTGDPGNLVLYAGSKTGKDGIHGASLLASTEFDETTEDKRPTVQVGDPFTEKLLIEACLELVQKDWVVGIQDMGAAGLTSSSFEMAGRSGAGIEINLSRVPLREGGMTPYDILLSESQERMLIVVKKGHENDVKAIFKKWDLEAEIIGKVTDTGKMEMTFENEIVVDLPIPLVVEDAPIYHRPAAQPSYLNESDGLNLNLLPVPERGEKALRELLSSFNLADKSWVYEQYDHMVGLNTLVLPGSDAAVIRVQDTQKALAIAVDGNSHYCHLNPFAGAQIAVAECCRNVVCAGGQPIGLTNCLNFGSPENPGTMWHFEQCVEGIGDACRFLEIPVVSGNVSLYNETKGKPIYPTPIVAIVGVLDDQTRHCTQWFKEPGHIIALLGLTMEELGATEYLDKMFQLCQGRVPHLDLKQENIIHRLCLDLIRRGYIASAHDCSDGGLSVTLAECCISGPEQALGAVIDLHSTIRTDALLFGESQSRIVISFPPENQEVVEKLAFEKQADFTMIGTVGGTHLTINVNDQEFIKEDVHTLKKIWQEPLEKYGRQVS